MSIDELLRAAGRITPDPLAVRRAYRRFDDEYRRRGAVRRWDAELALLPDDQRIQLARLTGLDAVLSWQSGDFTAVCRPPDEQELVARRRFLAHACAVAVGAYVLGDPEPPWARPRAMSAEPIDSDRVDRLEATRRTVELLFEREGSVSCRAALLAVLAEPIPVHPSAAEKPVWLRFLWNRAKLHNLAGWVAFDLGSLQDAREHLGHALELAKVVDDDLLIAHILYRAGRMYLHLDAPNDALMLFQLGQIPAQTHKSRLLVAVICGNQGWAYACLGHQEQAMKLFGRMRDEFAAMDAAEHALVRKVLDSGRDPVDFVDDIVAGLEQSRLTRAG
ncbi:MAG TPA: tetratricopeptide repeat protein [Actinophytocola sp.]|uniref:tetratricopeptide repeat protein n=1 Tax=Actinophytocola sp. TaxID=1872138 RepID=UPI002DDD7432|nr:tetratricopeptide repeat protein [Actinophytocola sp.]HEV2780813.1 tetratricopeptide repeat protein [Actinophytocola sp.]